MASCVFCLRRCLAANCSREASNRRRDQQRNVILDTNYMGNEVVIVKNGHRICGDGAALANAPIVQDKAYFEVKLQQAGTWGLGLATRNVDLNRTPLGNDGDSWVMTSKAVVMHAAEAKAKATDVPQEGDVVGVSYDHVELNFYLNGGSMRCPVSGLRGTLYPVVYVEDGAIMDVHFNDFFHPPPLGFNGIMIEQSLL